ncbi:hypothetical protein [Paenibacillus sp. 37]|uniref:hypothetical protein n=2 Tax=Paenibacillus TaxID=44249 RepID=UPI001CB760DF|nr:hypothetical protein [Paenibacillus sp. 37]
MDISAIFGGRDVVKMNEWQLKPLHKRIEKIFQDPYSSLNSGMKILLIISEPVVRFEGRDEGTMLTS